MALQKLQTSRRLLLHLEHPTALAAQETCVGAAAVEGDERPGEGQRQVGSTCVDAEQDALIVKRTLQNQQRASGLDDAHGALLQRRIAGAESSQKPEPAHELHILMSPGVAPAVEGILAALEACLVGVVDRGGAGPAVENRRSKPGQADAALTLIGCEGVVCTGFVVVGEIRAAQQREDAGVSWVPRMFIMLRWAGHG